jgi:hypothetical protein
MSGDLKGKINNNADALLKYIGVEDMKRKFFSL